MASHQRPRTDPWRERLQSFLPQIFSSQATPVLNWLVDAGGRLTKRTLHGDTPEGVLEAAACESLFAFVAELSKEPVFLKREDDIVMGGVIPSRGRGQIWLALSEQRTFSDSDWEPVLSSAVRAYLRLLIGTGRHVWIVGDTGAEADLAVSLCARSTLWVVEDAQLLPPGAVRLPSETSLEAAIEAKRNGGFGHLIWRGELGAEVLKSLESSSGVILLQRGHTVETALQRSELHSDPGTAALLPLLSAVIHLELSTQGAVCVSQVAEFQSSADGVLAVAVATRTHGAVAFTRSPQLAAVLETSGAEAFFRDITTEVEEPMASGVGALLIRQSIAQRQREATPEHEPGWELDALGEDALIGAPGAEGLLRARPLVRPAAPTANPEEPGDLVLDLPERKILITEAPSAQRAKRSFADILRERHRYPRMSADGSPTLTPPVLDAEGAVADDEDITPE